MHCYCMSIANTDLKMSMKWVKNQVEKSSMLSGFPMNTIFTSCNCSEDDWKGLAIQAKMIAMERMKFREGCGI